MGRKFSLSGTPFNFILVVRFASPPHLACTCQKMKKTEKEKKRRRRRIINDGCAIPRQKWRHGVTSPWGYIKRPRSIKGACQFEWEEYHAYMYYNYSNVIIIIIIILMS